MRPTWVVLSLVVALGAVAYVKLRSKAESTPPLAKTGSDAPVGPVGPGGGNDGTKPSDANSPAGSPPLAAPAVSGPEAKAAEIRAAMMARLEARDEAGATALEKTLDGELRDTDGARRHAMERGAAALHAADGKPLSEALPLLDRARRDLSRGIYLREMFDAAGKPTDERKRLVEAIAHANAKVMTAAAAVAGVTRPYLVKQGDSPVGIVTRDRLTYGHNAILYWSHGGDFDPTRLRAGETLMLPVETLSIEVRLDRHLLDVYLGDWLVKEFEVGVGARETPTPLDDYEVGDKQRNPDWTPPGGKRIPFGSPENELGDAWIEIKSPSHPKGLGIHGTNKPETVGTDCSHGCVRLRNPEVDEIFWWVRTGRSGGQATKVHVR